MLVYQRVIIVIWCNMVQFCWQPQESLSFGEGFMRQGDDLRMISRVCHIDGDESMKTWDFGGFNMV